VQVLLTATAYYDGTQCHTKGAEALEYNGYGSAATEVEVTTCAGYIGFMSALLPDLPEPADRLRTQP